MSGPFNTAIIEQRLREQVPDLHAVGSAADYARIQQLSSFRTPCAYVVLLKEAAQNDAERQTHKVNVTFGVFIAARNYSDSTGAAAAQDANPLIGKVRSALIGFRPGERSKGVTACLWESGALEDYDNNVLLWSDIFTTRYFIN